MTNYERKVNIETCVYDYYKRNTKVYGNWFMTTIEMKLMNTILYDQIHGVRTLHFDLKDHKIQVARRIKHYKKYVFTPLLTLDEF
jgi:hypothetical protein